MQLVEVVVSTAHKRQLLRRFPHAHAHACLFRGCHLLPEHIHDFPLRRRRKLDVCRQLLTCAPSVLERLQHPLEQIYLSPHLYLPFVWEAPSAWNQSKYISPSLYHHVLTRSRSSAELNHTGSPFKGRNTFTRRSVVVCHKPVK